MTSPSLPGLARWIVHLAAFPLTGLAAWLLFGPIDSPATAAGGGAIAGLGVGAAQAWALDHARPVRWSAALAFTVLLAVTTALVRQRSAVRA